MYCFQIMKCTVGLFRPTQWLYWFSACFHICAWSSLGFHPQSNLMLTRQTLGFSLSHLPFSQWERWRTKWHTPVDLNPFFWAPIFHELKLLLKLIGLNLVSYRLAFFVKGTGKCSFLCQAHFAHNKICFLLVRRKIRISKE